MSHHETLDSDARHEWRFSVYYVSGVGILAEVVEWDVGALRPDSVTWDIFGAWKWRARPIRARLTKARLAAIVHEQRPLALEAIAERRAALREVAA